MAKQKMNETVMILIAAFVILFVLPRFIPFMFVAIIALLGIILYANSKRKKKWF